ncbi:MAG: dockerin type I domain-containing protein [Chthoniobacterales bacterium]
MKKIVTHFTLPLLALVGVASGIAVAQNTRDKSETGTLETLIVATGTVALDLDLNRLNGASNKETRMETLRLKAMDNSFFPVLVMNGEFRGPKLGMMALTGEDSPSLPTALRDSFSRLVIEKVDWSGDHDLVVRDGKTGFVFFNIEGHHYAYDAQTKALQITDGRLLVSDGFAKNMGRPADAGASVGNISVAATMRPIEVAQIVNGEVESAVQPAVGTVPGPDVIVGDIIGVEQAVSGATNGFVGLGVGTTSCNAGVVNLNWFQMPNTDHPVIPQNLYRMSGGASNNERFEQIGQSWMKHAFTALTQNICSFGCNGTGGSQLGSGCSDPYTASLNYSQSGIGSRAWVNPFTGAFPTTARDHTGHSHTPVSHRLMVAVSDLVPAQNPGATYYAEGQYVTPHEYAWCQSHPGECNMNNNVSYRQYTPSGTTTFSFATNGSTTQRTKPAITAWNGATLAGIEPAPGVDGIGTMAYKVTNPSAGVWHYEYAIYNQNMNRGIQSFSVPLGCGVAATNIGFHAPINDAGFANDGTVGSAGISNAGWTTNQTADALTWSSETFAQNPNANALRWGLLFNFRFDSNRPPVTTNATIGFYKTGAPIVVAIQSPQPQPCAPLTFASAVSRKTHGAAGTFDINLPLSGEPGVECRTGDVSMVFTFSNNVVSGNAAVTAGTGSVGTTTFSGNTMTVNVSGVTDQQKLTVNLSSVTDEFSQTMPDTTVSVNMLLGDVNGNKAVNGTDVGQTKLAAGAVLDGTNFRADVNASGGVNGTDIGQVKAAVGHSVP